MRDKVIKEIFYDIAEEFGLTEKEVESIFDSQWDFIRDTIIELELNDVSEEEFEDIKTNFNIPAIGKLHTNFNKIKNVTEKSKIIKERREAARDDVQSDTDNSR